MALATAAMPLAERMDPDWPPVLIVAVLAVVSGAAISIVMMLKRVRAEIRDGRHGRGGGQ